MIGETDKVTNLTTTFNKEFRDMINTKDHTPNVFSPMYNRMLSFVFRIFSVWFQNALRTRRIDLEWTELFPHDTENVRKAFVMF